jgi:hypothetical protein
MYLITIMKGGGVAKEGMIRQVYLFNPSLVARLDEIFNLPTYFDMDW